jgi:murein DD-endopeptidase MepM/ murein hydrolase activator NlpD
LLCVLASVLLLLGCPGPLRADDPPRLDLPIACVPGRDCWILNYVDADSGPQRRDYACGTLTYDKHNGTDFALADRAVMDRGVDVLAAAPGRVTATREGVEDRDFREVGREAVDAIGCGNQVILDHGGGWRTRYCHMKRDSLAVKTGDQVERGARLGQVGMSGLTQFPHVHFSVYLGNRAIDPFVGVGAAPACGLGDRPLWSEDALVMLAYRPVELFNIGFAAAEPTQAAVQRGEHASRNLPAGIPLVVFWAELAGVARDDRVTLRIYAPDGALLAESVRTAERDRALTFQYIGRRRPPGGWSSGSYRGEVAVSRPGPAGRTTVSRTVIATMP